MIDDHEKTTKPVRWADEAQFHAKEHLHWKPSSGVEPRVYLLWMTPDPLGAIAALCEMYKGNVIRRLRDVTNEMRMDALEDVQKTHLKAPLEAVKFHFMIDGVDRAFTHQHVRQRTAVFAQESMRFAVVEDLPHNTTLPPSLHGTEPASHYDRDEQLLPAANQAQRWRNRWDSAIEAIGRAYEELVNDGMPAEEARGLLPHATATRLNYVTDLRNLSDHAGNRLCTQAQFHWRSVFSQIVGCIRQFGVDTEDEWQFNLLADSGLFRPVCYQIGHCPFKASFDRACTIRGRVDSFARQGVPSAHWHLDNDGLAPISPAEWIMDPSAARS